MAKDVKDVGASVRARLLNLARKKGQSHELLLTRYALERLLYTGSRKPNTPNGSCSKARC